MIRNIYEYSGTHEFCKAVFLIGAGHRKSIMNKIKVCETNSKNLQWNFALPNE
jgi:pheromone shutdown protein TraB